MAFKLTYTDGQEAEYDDDTAWEVDDGVLKLGRSEGDWTVLVSPSHWAVIEIGTPASRADDGSSDGEKPDTDEDSDGNSDDDKPKGDKPKDDKPEDDKKKDD